MYAYMHTVAFRIIIETTFPRLASQSWPLPVPSLIPTKFTGQNWVVLCAMLNSSGWKRHLGCSGFYTSLLVGTVYTEMARISDFLSVTYLKDP